MEIFLAIDPGREKTGLAILDYSGKALRHYIVESDKLIPEISKLMKEYNLKELVMGDGTSSKKKHEMIAKTFPLIKFSITNEYRTTDEARKIYFQDNPPKGLKRLIPLGMQVPSGPIDDYAAIAIGRRYLQQHK